MGLETELQVYNDHLMELLGVDDVNAGKYIVIVGEVVDGPFDDYPEALRFGYRKYGPRPYLAKKIERVQSVMFIARESL